MPPSKIKKAASRRGSPDAQPPKKSGNAPEKSVVAPSHPENDRAWKLARLAAILASNLKHTEDLSSVIRVNPPLSSRMLDSFFAAALKRADTLLHWAEGKGGQVHAYQIFDEGLEFTEQGLFENFKKWNWNGLQSKQPIMDLMKRVRELFERELAVSSKPLELGGVEDLAHAVKESIRSVLVGHLGCQFESFEDRVKGIVNEIERTLLNTLFESFGAGNRVEDYWEIERARSFFDWCFPEAAEGKRAERLYRPNEIFRRCATRRWFDNSLIRDRGDLNPASIPFPPADGRSEVFAQFDASRWSSHRSC